MAGSFLVPVKKRKAAPPKAPPKKKNKEDTVDDEIISDGEDGGNVLSGFDNEKRVRMQKEEEDRNDNEDIYEKETADERRARMAREMIQQLGGRMEVDSDGEEQMALSEEDESDPDHDAISHRLHEAALFEAGTLQRNVAGKVDADGVEVVKRLRRAHHKTVTCAAVSNDGSLAFSCGKEGKVIIWNLETMTKMRVLIDEEASVKPHPLCLAVSYDASLLVVGYDDGFIRCWNVGETKIAARLRAHKSAVNGICFRSGSKMFMSCGEDLLVKVWNGDGLSFIETLFGHQSPVYSVHAMNKERAVSVSSDHTARLWKIEEETQLIFRSSMHSVDTVCNINDELFVTGADDGTLSVWSLSKKKPAASVKHAHGEGHENWISSVAAAPFTDMLASGSRDGFIRLWKNEHTKKKITQIAEIPVDGFVNSLSFSKDGSTLVAATGPEPRLGRWDNVKAQPAVVVIKIPISK